MNGEQSGRSSETAIELLEHIFQRIGVDDDTQSSICRILAHLTVEEISQSNEQIDRKTPLFVERVARAVEKRVVRQVRVSDQPDALVQMRGFARRNRPLLTAWSLCCIALLAGLLCTVLVAMRMRSVRAELLSCKDEMRILRTESQAREVRDPVDSSDGAGVEP